MTKIFHIVQRMAPGGIESVVLDLARLDPDVRVVSLEGLRGDLVAAWPPLAELGERLIALDKPEGTRPGLWMQLARLLRAEQARAIVTHHIGPLFYAGIGAVLAGIRHRVHVEHDGWHYAGRRRRLLGRLMDLAVAPRRVAVSGVTADQVAKALHVGAQTIIPNGVDLARFVPGDRRAARRAFGLPEDVRIIGNVGRLEAVKGQDVLISALASLPKDVHLVLAGDGTRREACERLAESLGFGARVHFLGNVSQPERLYPAFDLFCLPSRAEGFPRALIEAQACDIPVIASNVGGVREAVCPATGLMIPAEDSPALAEAVLVALEMARNVRPRGFVEPSFSNEVMAARYRALACF